MNVYSVRVLEKIQAKPALEKLCEDAADEAVRQACLASDRYDSPIPYMLSFLANNLEENDEHPALHRCWIHGAEVCELAEYFLAPAIDSFFRARREEAALVRSLRRCEI